MTERFQFVEIGSTPPRQQDLWPSIVVPRGAIEAEAGHLASIALPSTGLRASAISHPHNKGPIPAFAPGIDVTLHVVKPGEQTAPIARNSTIVDMCIGGEGVATIGIPLVQSQANRCVEYTIARTPQLSQ